MTAPVPRPSPHPSDTNPLIAPRRERPTRPRPRWLLPALALGALVIIGGSALAWRPWREPSRTVPDETPTVNAVDLIAPLGDPAQPGAPWLRLRVEPARPGENSISAAVADKTGTPLPSVDAQTISLRFASLDEPGPDRQFEIRPDETGQATHRGNQLDREGWWRIAATLNQPGQPAITVPFYLLLPDPNVNGTSAVKTPRSSPEATALYERGLASMTGWHRVRFRQSMADGQGHVAISEHAVNDGTDGQPPALHYRAPGGIEAYIVGGWRWLRRPGEDWVVDGSPPMVPPAAWGEEIEGATGFRLGKLEEVEGELCRIVTFVVPERTEPQRQRAAWYAWWIGAQSGQLHREAMVSESHYMVNEFRDFDAPLTISPPTAAAGGTPAPP